MDISTHIHVGHFKLSLCDPKMLGISTAYSMVTSQAISTAYSMVTSQAISTAYSMVTSQAQVDTVNSFPYMRVNLQGFLRVVSLIHTHTHSLVSQSATHTHTHSLVSQSATHTHTHSLVSQSATHTHTHSLVSQSATHTYTLTCEGCCAPSFFSCPLQPHRILLTCLCWKLQESLH